MTHEPYIHTSSGRRIYVRHPYLNDSLHLADFAHSLARIARYNGHAAHRYSVASHCLMVSDLVPLEYRAAGLGHDAVEAVLGDVTSPLKSLIPAYRELQDAWEDGLERRWGIALHGPEVKIADRLAYTIERRDLMLASVGDEPWPSSDYLVDVLPSAPRCISYVGRPEFVARWWYARARDLGFPEVA